MSNIRLLLIEDDPDVAELLTTYFKIVAYEVFHAADGAEGIAMARSHFPNLILLDVMLPDMTGWDITQRLRTSALTRYIPIIFLTQRHERSAKIKGLGLGADDYITKPFDMEELRLRVQAALRRATQDRLYEPRTGLPGDPLIKAELQALQDKQGWHHLGIHIERLGEFRERYGFLAADEALAQTARVIQATVKEHGTPDDFIGVTDADEFVVITFTDDLNTFRRTLQDSFAHTVRTLYNFQDAERGYMELDSGAAAAVQVPLMSLNIQRRT